MSGNDWYVYCTHWCISSIQPWLDHLLGKHFNCVWPLSERLTLLPFTLPISLPLPFCFPSGTLRMPVLPLSLSCQPLPSQAPSSVEKVVSSSALSRRFRFASERSETSWFVWQTQMPLNSHSPGSLPASYLVMHYSHPLWQTPLHPPPQLSRIRRGTATHDFPGRKSIRPWRLCFKWAINRTASRIYFLS